MENVKIKIFNVLSYLFKEEPIEEKVYIDLVTPYATLSNELLLHTYRKAKIFRKIYLPLNLSLNLTYNVEMFNISQGIIPGNEQEVFYRHNLQGYVEDFSIVRKLITSKIDIFLKRDIKYYEIDLEASFNNW